MREIDGGPPYEYRKEMSRCLYCNVWWHVDDLIKGKCPECRGEVRTDGAFVIPIKGDDEDA